MNGVHDMGGMHGFGPVEVEAGEPVFHASWEGRVLALRRAAGAWRRWNIDAGRHSIERLPPDWIVSIHAPLACVDWDGPGEALARAMSRANGLPARKVGYPTPGSFGSWAGVDRGIATVTLELDDRLEPEETQQVTLEPEKTQEVAQEPERTLLHFVPPRTKWRVIQARFQVSSEPEETQEVAEEPEKET